MDPIAEAGSDFLIAGVNVPIELIKPCEQDVPELTKARSPIAAMTFPHRMPGGKRVER
jgi:hypothetical protein